MSITLNLPADEVDSLQSFASEHGLTMAELIGRFARGLKTVSPASIHPEVLALTGLVPADWDVEAAHCKHLAEKLSPVITPTSLRKLKPKSVGAVLRPFPSPEDDTLGEMLDSRQ